MEGPGGGRDCSGGSPERRTGTDKGLFSNIWLWRGVAGVLAAAVILILCFQFVNHSSAKDLLACPSLDLCPSGWLYFQRKCYYLSDSEANWNSSQSLCSLHNASLLVIENHQELSFMVKITKEDPWIGLYKRNEEFFWVNGKALDNKIGHMSLGGLLTGHCNTSFESRVGQGDPYFLRRDSYVVETGLK